MARPACSDGVGFPRIRDGSRGPGTHDRNDPPGEGQILPARVSTDQVEELDRREVDLLVERVHGRHDLVVHAQPVVRLAHLQLHRERAEEGRVGGAASGISVVAVHDVVVDGRQSARLEAVPEPLGVRDDPPIDQRVRLRSGARHRGDPARGDPNLLVVAEPVEVRAQHPLGLERLVQQRPPVGGQRANPVHRTRVHHFEAHLPRVQPQVACQHFVDGEYLVEPAEGRVNGLLGPLGGRLVPQELDRDLVQARAHVRVGVGEPGADRFPQPGEPLLERRQDLNAGGLRVGPRLQ